MNTLLSNIENIDKTIKDTNNIVKETYKKVQLIKNTSSDQELINSNVNTLIDNYYKIIDLSYNVDDVKIWDEVVDNIDNQNTEELETKTYSEFFLGAQMVRGKVKGLKEFSYNLKKVTNNVNKDNINNTKQINNNSIAVKENSNKNLNLNASSSFDDYNCEL